MRKLRILIPALFTLAAFPAVSEAQLSIPLCETTYSVQVQYEHWRSGGRYWATKFTTDNQQDAQLMYDLFVAAREAGQLCDILGCSFDFIIVDIKLVTTTKCHIPSFEPLRLSPTKNDFYLKSR